MSVLGGRFDGGRVLDLCAGTGAVALEFLSRGVASAVMVERDGRALACLRENVASAKMEHRTHVEEGDVLAVLKRLQGTEPAFDWVFFDPPYDSDIYGPALALLAGAGLLTDEAEVIVESGQGLDDAIVGDRWERLEQRRYGAARFDRLRSADKANAR